MSDPLESDRDPALSSIDFLASSRHRLAILETLRESGPATRRELREAVDASRSTVRRTLEGFLQRDWIVQVEDGYRLTAAGGFVAAEFGQLALTVDLADEYAPLLRHLPDDAVDVDPAWLEGGELTVTTDGDPYAPALRQTETVRSASQFRGLLPSIELEGAKLVHERIVDGDLEATVVLSSGAAETVRSEPFAELFREKIATGRLDVYAHDSHIPMYLGLADGERVELGCENEQGIPQALLQSTDDRLREWGEARLEEYVAAADRLSEERF